MHNPLTKQQLLSQLKDERSTLHDLVWELDELEVALAELEAEYASKSHVNEAITSRLERLRERYDMLQEAVLGQMLHLDHLQARFDQLPYPQVRAA